MLKFCLIVGFYVLVFFGVVVFNYILGLMDVQGCVFGIFVLDIYDDSLYLVLVIWVVMVVYLLVWVFRIFLFYFGIFYFGDGLLGLIIGLGYLDFGIINYGILDLLFGFKILVNLLYLFFGGVVIILSYVFVREVC